MQSIYKLRQFRHVIIHHIPKSTADRLTLHGYYLHFHCIPYGEGYEDIHGVDLGLTLCTAIFYYACNVYFFCENHIRWRRVITFFIFYGFIFYNFFIFYGC